MGARNSVNEQAFERLRRWPRAAVHLPVSFSFGKSKTFDAGAISDLSEGGLRLVSSSLAKPGDLLKIELVFVPGLQAQELFGIVVWRFGDVFGIEFVTPSTKKNRQILRRVVQYHLGV